MEQQRVSRGADTQLDRTRSDIVALAVAMAAILMFVGNGGSALTQAIKAMAGTGLGPDRLLSSALYLNIALIIFGWRRYRELTGEVTERRRAEARAAASRGRSADGLPQSPSHCRRD